jgi:flagella basal body P-ring formation protein FlgA
MLRTALSLAVALAFASPAFAEVAAEAPHPVLKASAVVNGPLVTVGDLVENAGIIAKVPIFRAPDLGTTGTVPAAAIADAVRAHALIGLDTAGLEEVRVTRAARMIPAKEIEAAVAEALADKYQLGLAKDVRVDFDRTLQAIYIEPSALAEPRVARIVYDARSGRFDASVDLPTGASSRGTLRLAGRAIATAEVVVAAHAIERGSVIKDADVVLERRPRTEIGRDPLGGNDIVIGMAARNSLAEGRVLHAPDLMKPELVQRNETVTLTFDIPGIALTVRGKALEAGAEGDVVSVLNEQSKRTLQGIVTGRGRVAIGSRSSRLAANITTRQ